MKFSYTSLHHRVSPSVKWFFMWACLGLSAYPGVSQQASSPHKMRNSAPTITEPEISFSAVPFGAYDVVKNKPLDKEYTAYAHWRAHYSGDGNFNKITAQPYLHGAATFSAIARRSGGDDSLPGTALFGEPHDIINAMDGTVLGTTGQRYIWQASPDLDIPVVPPAPPENNPTITVMRDGLSALDFLTELGQWKVRSVLPDNLEHYLPLPSTMAPPWWEDFVWNVQLAHDTAQTPSKWETAKSEPEKVFHWDLSGGQAFPKETEVKVQITGSKVDDPILNGKVKIKFYREPQTIYDIDLLPLEWQRTESGYLWGDAGAGIYTFFSNDELVTRIGQWACGEGIIQGVGIVTAEAAPIGLHVVLRQPRAAGWVSKVFGDEFVESLITATGKAKNARVEELEKWKAPRKSGARAREIGIDESTQVETATTKRGFGEDGTPTENTTETKKGPNCFVAGTLVVMGDGTLKPIEKVRVGDLVLSREMAVGDTAAERVTHVISNSCSDILDLHMSDGQTITVTPNHPIFTPTTNPRITMAIPAGKLAIGTSILTRAGPPLQLCEVKKKSGRFAVYNLSVEGYHTFFVTQKSQSASRAVWVHNAPDGVCPGTDDEGDIVDPSSEVSRNTYTPQIDLLDTSIEKVAEKLPRSRLGESNSLRSAVSAATFEKTLPDGEIEWSAHRVAVSGADVEWQMVTDETGKLVQARDPITDDPIPKRNENGDIIYKPLNGKDGTALDVAQGTGKLSGHTHHVDAPGQHPYSREWDSEVKLMEEWQEKADADSSLRGTLLIKTTKESCNSCKDLANWWNTQSQYKDRIQIKLYWDENGAS